MEGRGGLRGLRGERRPGRGRAGLATRKFGGRFKERRKEGKTPGKIPLPINADGGDLVWRRGEIAIGAKEWGAGEEWGRLAAENANRGNK